MDGNSRTDMKYEAWLRFSPKWLIPPFFIQLKTGPLSCLRGIAAPPPSSFHLIGISLMSFSCRCVFYFLPSSPNEMFEAPVVLALSHGGNNPEPLDLPILLDVMAAHSGALYRRGTLDNAAFQPAFNQIPIFF